MPRHHRLRYAVLTAVTAGALLVPASAAFASDENPTPSTKASESDNPTEAMKKAADAKAEAAKRAGMSKESSAEEIRKGEAARKAEALKRAGAADAVPRGGVAAGEAPAGNTDMTTLVGSATGALLLAGAGTLVLRRRSAERHNV
ncbi:hypothetical protein [Streptomyces sp. NPDC088400]|uniref:hypothetical protein n=1 Tax=Streptomyces sp. NPDC088400 TaxID=3365861 RepID=UPI003808F95D